MQACIHDAHSTRSSHALKMLLQTFCPSTSSHGETQRDAAYDRVSCVDAAYCSESYSAAAYEVGYADLSRPLLCVSWPSGLLAVALVVWSAGNGGRWLGMVTSYTMAGYGSSGGDVSVR